MTETVDEIVAALASDAVSELSRLSDETFLREAMLKCFIRDVTWSLYNVFDEKYAIVEQLRVMADILEQSRQSD